jgi:HAD superfamily hydrolase (TIGR01509 family)
MALKAALFDFDGLILDTESPEVQAWHETFHDFGLTFPDELWMAMIGQSTPDSITLPWRHLRELGHEFDQPTLTERNRVRRLELIEKLDPLPGVLALLDQCESLGIRKMVVSSSGRPWLERHLGRLGLLERFERLVCGHEGLPSKPAPDLYIEATRLMDVPKEEIVVFEDSPNGVKAAKGAGLYVVAVPNALTQKLDLSFADQQVSSLNQIDLSRWPWQTQP